MQAVGTLLTENDTFTKNEMCAKSLYEDYNCCSLILCPMTKDTVVSADAWGRSPFLIYFSYSRRALSFDKLSTDFLG